MDGHIAWYRLGYRWWLLKHWWARLPDRLARWVAWHLPAQVALHAFVRVYGSWGECGPDYEPVSRAWEARERRGRS